MFVAIFGIFEQLYVCHPHPPPRLKYRLVEMSQKGLEIMLCDRETC